jgi:hypothetical protein
VSFVFFVVKWFSVMRKDSSILKTMAVLLKAALMVLAAVFVLHAETSGGTSNSPVKGTGWYMGIWVGKSPDS